MIKNLKKATKIALIAELRELEKEYLREKKFSDRLSLDCNKKDAELKKLQDYLAEPSELDPQETKRLREQLNVSRETVTELNTILKEVRNEAETYRNQWAVADGECMYLKARLQVLGEAYLLLSASDMTGREKVFANNTKGKHIRELITQNAIKNRVPGAPENEKSNA